VAKFFGIILAAGVAGTSLAMLVMKGKWQAVEAAGMVVKNARGGFTWSRSF